MQVSVSGRHVNVTEEIKAYAAKKAEKLPRFYDRVQAIEVILDHEGGNFTVDMIVTSGKANFIAHEAGSDVFALLDMIVDKVGRQLTRHKEKFRNRKHLSKHADRFEEA